MMIVAIEIRNTLSEQEKLMIMIANQQSLTYENSKKEERRTLDGFGK